MKDLSQVRDQQWMLPEWERVPRSSAIVLAVVAHLIALPLIFFLFWRATRTHIVPQEYKSVQILSGTTHLAYNSKPSQPHARPLYLHRRTRQTQTRMAESGATNQVMPGKTLREQAKQATAAITMDLRFRQIYGFSRSHDYQLAVQIAGQIPSISPDEVPPHFEQYVTVEVTIASDGRVAEARVVAGMVPSTVEQTLLSAIREFKYSPAKRDGVPIPSQRDIVVHIPS